MCSSLRSLTGLAFAGLLLLGVDAQAQVNNCGWSTFIDAGAGICCGSGKCVSACLADGGGSCGGGGGAGGDSFWSDAGGGGIYTQGNELVAVGVFNDFDILGTLNVIGGNVAVHSGYSFCFDFPACAVNMAESGFDIVTDARVTGLPGTGPDDFVTLSQLSSVGSFTLSYDGGSPGEIPILIADAGLGMYQISSSNNQRFQIVQDTSGQTDYTELFVPRDQTSYQGAGVFIGGQNGDYIIWNDTLGHKSNSGPALTFYNATQEINQFLINANGGEVEAGTTNSCASGAGVFYGPTVNGGLGWFPFAACGGTNAAALGVFGNADVAGQMLVAPNITAGPGSGALQVFGPADGGHMVDFLYVDGGPILGASFGTYINRNGLLSAGYNTFGGFADPGANATMNVQEWLAPFPGHALAVSTTPIEAGNSPTTGDGGYQQTILVDLTTSTTLCTGAPQPCSTTNAITTACGTETSATAYSALDTLLVQYVTFGCGLLAGPLYPDANVQAQLVSP
jgi:hypothetical protein